MALVLDFHGLAVDLAHEAGLLAAVLLVEPDQHLAELGLEDVGEEEDRRLEHDPGEAVGRRQCGDDIEEPGGAAVLERHDGEDAQRWVEDDEEPAERDFALANLGVGRDGAIEP